MSVPPLHDSDRETEGEREREREPLALSLVIKPMHTFLCMKKGHKESGEDDS